MILKEAVVRAQEKYFSKAKSDADYMSSVMAYYKENLHIMKLAIGGLQNQLNVITKKYSDKYDDETVLKWAGEIKNLFLKHNAVKNVNFDPIEYLAVNYIAGNHGSDHWVDMCKK